MSPPVTVTQTAARNFGDGGLATAAPTDARSVTTAADGAVLFWDSAAHEIRRIDPGTGIVTAIAGTGSAPTRIAECNISGSTPASDVALASVGGLWTDTAGDVFMWTGFSQDCGGFGNVYRLDPASHLWSVAVQNLGAGPQYQYSAVTVDAAGDVFVSDPHHAVIRKFAFGADPQSAGVVVAGTLDSPGDSGDGGLATAAQIDGPGYLAAAADGSLEMSSSHTIRRVAAGTGLIDTVAGTGTGTPAGAPSVDDGKLATQARIDVAGLATSADGQTTYFDDVSGNQAADRVFTLGGTVHTVVGPAANNDSGDPAKSPGSDMATDPADASRLIVSTTGYLRRWALDGSAATSDGTLIAGLPTVDGMEQSADGAPLSDAFVSPIAIAEAPNGSYALATRDDVRGLSGLSANDTLSTLSHTGAFSLSYDSDGDLYALDCDLGEPNTGNCAVRVVVSGSPDVVVLGGGNNALADGETGTNVALPDDTTSIAVNRSTHTLYLVAGRSPSQVWGLDLSSDQVHLVAGNGTAGNPVDTADARTAPLSGLHDVGVDPSTNAVIVDTSPGVALYEIDSDGSLKVLGGSTDANSPDSVQVGPNGTVYAGGPALVSFGADGASEIQLPTFGGVFTVRPDGSIVNRGGDNSGGLLAVSDVMPAPSYPGPLPTISAQPGPASVTLTVTPPATSGETVTVRALPAASSIRYPVGGSPVATFTTDGTTTPKTFAVHRLGNAVLVAGTAYRFDAIISDRDLSAPLGSATPVYSAPQSATATPTVDTTAPASPGITAAQTNALIATVSITLPADEDVQTIELREAAGATPPATPADGQNAGDIDVSADQPGQTIHQTPTAPATSVVSFTAFAIDTSGNVSAGASATKPAATLLAGTAGGTIGWASQPGAVDVVWSGQVSDVRYSPGTSPPGTPSDGAVAGVDSTAWGYGASIPVTTGNKVAVSLFDYNADATGYTRTSFVLTGGELPSDVLAMHGPATVQLGKQVTVTASLQRHSPDGVHPVADQQVTLYEQPGGPHSSKWVAGCWTSAAGVCSMQAPAPSGETKYQTRSSDIELVPLTATITTNVQQTVSIALSRGSVKAGKLVTVSGRVSSHRALPVRLQRRVMGSWQTVKKLYTNDNGNYAYPYAPKHRGSYRLRILIPATRSLLAAHSATRRLRVD